MSALTTKTWAWLALGVVLVIVGIVVLDGLAGSIVLALGGLAILGAGIRFFSGGDERPPEERRVPAGHSGV